MDKALSGETVVFVSNGMPVLELRRTEPKWTPAEFASAIDEVALETKDLPSIGQSPADFVREMREEAS